MKNNLEEGFEQDDNNDLEIIKYGIKQKKNKKAYNIIFILIIILIIIFFITSVWLFYLFNITKAQNKYLKSELRKINLENKTIKTNLINAENQLRELTEKYKNEKDKNYELNINNINETVNLNKKISDLENDKNNIVKEYKKQIEKNLVLEEQNKALINQLKEEKEKNDKLSNDVKVANEHIRKIENEYVFLKRDKNSREVIIVDNKIEDENIEKDIINIATEAINLNSDAGGIAYYIKNEFDNKYEPTWECIVGYDYGYSINYESKKYTLFYLGQYKILLFKIPK